MLAVVVALAALWMVVYLLPDVIFHHLQWGAFQAVTDRPQVALTFDDGPGPDTAEILDELRRLSVRATFFVIAERAQQHPELLARMQAEGHDIALHMSSHVSAFVLWPWQSYGKIRQGLDALERLTGVRPRYFRPPWGHVNLGTWIAVRRFGLIPVFWQVAPDDWRPDRHAQQIADYVVKLAQPGVVVVLHDAGGSRVETRRSLSPMVDGLRSHGLEPVAVGHLTRDHSWVRRAWTWWEINFTRRWNVESIPNSGGGTPFLRIGHIRYRGPSVSLASGAVLRPGDAMGEIHFGNPALAQFSEKANLGLKALRGVRAAMHDLADWLANRPDYDDIVAVGGVTLLGAARTIERLGFVQVPTRGWTKWSMWVYLLVLMSVYHRQGWRTLRRFRRLKPVLVLCDRNTFQTRYKTRTADQRPF